MIILLMGKDIWSEERKHIEVVAAIIKKDNTILATQRGYGGSKDGWEFQVVKLRLAKLTR